MQNDLNKNCLCDGHPSKNKKIVFSEGRKKLTIKNPKQLTFKGYHVDSCLLKNYNSFSRCDNLCEVQESCIVYFVEFKGGNVSHACNQILNTVDYYKDRYASKTKYCHIISNNSPPAIKSKINETKIKLKKYNAYLKVHCKDNIEITHD